MKIYVSVDMEGIAGVVIREQLRRGEAFYEEGRRLVTREVNVLVDSLLAAGATDIIVKDAHGTGFNFLVEQLHKGARYVMGAARTERRFPGLDDTFDGAFLIGYHAMAGALDAVRDHTYVPTDWQQLTLNEAAIGEIGLDALFFGHYGVPVLLVSGDDKACAEARRQLGDVSTYQTKVGFGKHVALLDPPSRVHERLPEVVREALQTAKERSPYEVPGPYTLTMRYAGTEHLDARYFDGEHAVRVDGTTVAYRDEDFLRLVARAL
ncbi:MAG: M55 family metallopeptidase, partial [Firmicutes bacterium]|nr:M55 family metallopeptidase [Bacillota bacterium]